MKVITGEDTRWSYANVWEPKSINGGTPKYSVSLIIPKSDTKTIAKIKAAIEAAYVEGEAKLKRPCSFPGCPNLTDGRFCPEHERQEQRRYEKYDRDKTSKRRYDHHQVDQPICA